MSTLCSFHAPETWDVNPVRSVAEMTDTRPRYMVVLNTGVPSELTRRQSDGVRVLLSYLQCSDIGLECKLIHLGFHEILAHQELMSSAFGEIRKRFQNCVGELNSYSVLEERSLGPIRKVSRSTFGRSGTADFSQLVSTFLLNLISDNGISLAARRTSRRNSFRSSPKADAPCFLFPPG